MLIPAMRRFGSFIGIHHGAKLLQTRIGISNDLRLSHDLAHATHIVVTRRDQFIVGFSVLFASTHPRCFSITKERTSFAVHVPASVLDGVPNGCYVPKFIDRLTFEIDCEGMVKRAFAVP